MLKTRFGIEPRILIMLLILGIIPMVLGALVLMRESEIAYSKSSGQNLSEVAETTTRALNHHIQRQIMNVAAITIVPEIKEAVIKSNQSIPKDREGIAKKIREVETRWNSFDINSPILRGLLNSPATNYLADLTRINPTYKEILVTDRVGRLVACNEKPSVYFQANETWWKKTYSDGSVYLGNIRTYDEGGKLHVIDLATPILDETKSVIGVVKVQLDAKDLLSTIVEGVRVGQTGHATLVSSDGMIISSPDEDFTSRRKLESFPRIKEAEERGQRYFIDGEGDDARIFGIAQTRIATKDSGFEDWLVIVEQPLMEANASLQNLRGRFFSLLGLIVLVTATLSIYFSWELTKPIIEQDMHLERL